MGWKSNVVVVNNQSATRKLFLLQFHWVLTTATFDFHPRIQPLHIYQTVSEINHRWHSTALRHTLSSLAPSGPIYPKFKSQTSTTTLMAWTMFPVAIAVIRFVFCSLEMVLPAVNYLFFEVEVHLRGTEEARSWTGCVGRTS